MDLVKDGHNWIVAAMNSEKTSPSLEGQGNDSSVES